MSTAQRTPQAGLDNPAAKKPLYEASTQFQHWRFSPEELEHTRNTLNAAAVTIIRRAFEVDAAGSSQDVAFLNAQDEQILIKLYVGKIAQLCGHFRFPEEVEATAVTYLKRFYLKNTVMDWHPKNVMLTALFLATKTTNNPITLEEYTSSIPRTEPADVLDLEFLVAQSLNFEFSVWHAHKAFWGLCLDLQSLPQQNSAVNEEDIYEAGLAHIRTSRLTDAELIYTPSQIALACLSMASETSAAEWMRMKGVELVSVIDAIKACLQSQGSLSEVDAVREVDRRLKLCKNPEKIVGSKAYLAKQEAETRRADERRSRKAAVAQRAMDAQDPFGNTNSTNGDGGPLDDDDDDD